VPAGSPVLRAAAASTAAPTMAVAGITPDLTRKARTRITLPHLLSDSATPWAPGDGPAVRVTVR
jgi:hypothetical protein